METRTNQEIETVMAERNEHTARLYDNDDLGLSIWANGMNNEKDRLAMEIRANGGNWTFPALFNLGGQRIRAKLIDGAYGMCWAFCDSLDHFTGQFISAFPARDSTMRRKGYAEGEEEAPAIAKHWAPEGARGTGGCLSVQTIVERLDKGYPDNAVSN
jgi:hypothetical protein